MSSLDKRARVEVELDSSGSPLVVGKAGGFSDDLLGVHGADEERAGPIIVIYGHEGEDELGRVQVDASAQKQDFTDAISAFEGANMVAFPVGETGEPTAMEVTDGIRAATDLGLSVQLHLPS